MLTHRRGVILHFLIRNLHLFPSKPAGGNWAGHYMQGKEIPRA